MIEDVPKKVNWHTYDWNDTWEVRASEIEHTHQLWIEDQRHEPEKDILTPSDQVHIVKEVIMRTVIVKLMVKSHSNK